ncbi:MAG: hypothetical protein ABEK16_04215 [Candidatus Nanohalobium sp.]
MRELVFEDNIEPFLEKREEQFRTVEEYYENQAIDEIQESIPLIKTALENAWGRAKNTEQDYNEEDAEKFENEIQEAYDVVSRPEVSGSDSELRNPVYQYIRELGAPPDWASGHEPTQFDHTFAKLKEVLDKDKELSKKKFRERYPELIERNKRNAKREVIEADQAHLIGRQFYHNLKKSKKTGAHKNYLLCLERRSQP